jgi:hypothetical protein
MNKKRKYTVSLKDAKLLFKVKTGSEWNVKKPLVNEISIYKLKIKRTKSRCYFVGSYLKWLNL